MARRGENITKRKDGRWEARYIKKHINGKAVYGFLYGKTYAEAKNKKAMMLQQTSQISAKKSAETFDSLINAYLVQKQYNAKESTYAHYCNIINTHILPSLGSMPLSEISAQTIERFASEKLKCGNLILNIGLSPKTVKDILSIVKSILKYGADNNLINRETMSFSLPRTNKKDVEALSNEERERLEKYTVDADNIHFGIYLCLYTGLRLGELCALKWEDINFSDEVINIRKTMLRISSASNDKKTKIIISSPKTETSNRQIPLPKDLVIMLKNRSIDISSQKDYFLTNSSKFIEPRNYYKKYKRIISKCGLERYTFHALRHTFATRCIEKGFDPKVLSEILGHSNVKITLDRYVHPSMDRRRSCMELLYK